MSLTLFFYGLESRFTKTNEEYAESIITIRTDNHTQRSRSAAQKNNISYKQLLFCTP